MAADRKGVVLTVAGLLLLATAAAPRGWGTPSTAATVAPGPPDAAGGGRAEPVGAAPVAAWLVEGIWTLRTPLGEVGGVLLLLRAEEGEATGQAWRCEVAMAEDGVLPRPADLRHRRGRGWTLVGGPDGGVVQPWSGPWRALGAEAAVALGDLAAAWTGRGVGHARDRVILRSWDALPAAWRPDRGAATRPAGRLRRELTARGAGRGGPGAVLRLEPAGRDLEVSSVRWPATLVVGPPDSAAVRVPPEAFLPLWPLADLLP